MITTTRARIGATAVLVVTALLIAGCTSNDGGDGKTEKSPAAKASTAGSQLFVASASKGELEPQDAEHEFTLTLGEANDSVGVFTDRPQRKAGTESLADFAAAWDKRGFTKTPPNAAVVWGKDSSTRVFELSGPAYDEAADSISFTAHDLGDESSTALSSFKGTPDAELPTELGEVAVFIDSAGSKSIDRNNAWITVDGAPNGVATVTFDNQTLDIVSATVTKGEAAASNSAAGVVGVQCLQGTSCYVIVHITLNPGTFPYAGNLKTSSSGMKVTAKYGDKPTEDFPPGAFSWVAAQ